MKKVSLLLAFFVLVFFSAQAQTDNNFGEGSSAINVGIGFGNTIYTGADYKMGFPTISASYEYGLVEIPMGSKLHGVISIGGLVGFGGSKYEYKYWHWGGYSVKTTYFLVAARANYHFIFHDKFDPYAGIILGGYFGNSKVTYDDGWNNTYPGYDANDSGFHGGAYVGARWFFTPAIAVFSELGWNISIFTAGVTFKF